jgi:hypothetical protein
MAEEYKEMKDAISRAFDMFLEQVSLLRSNTPLYGQKFEIDPYFDKKGVMLSASVIGYAIFDQPVYDEDEDEWSEPDYKTILNLDITRKGERERRKKVKASTRNKKESVEEKAQSLLDVPWVLEKFVSE